MPAAAESPLKAIEADASAPVEGVEVPLVTVDDDGKEQTVTLTVPPVGRWRARSIRAMRQGDYFEWAETVLSKGDAAAFTHADPVLDEVGAFFVAWQERSGETRGKSSRSTKS